MNIFESVPEAEFRQKVHRFAKEHVTPIAEKVEEGMFPATYFGNSESSISLAPPFRRPMAVGD